VNNPLIDDESGPVGEYPDVPARSGVTAVLKAADAVTAAAAGHSDRELKLQRAIDDVRVWCQGYGPKGSVPAEEILNIIESHRV
jgi:hypothetical protein